VLAEKGVPYETTIIDLSNRPHWLLEHNPPDGRVPVLEEEGWVLPESAVIDEYLEERYPEPPLWPADAGARAAARLLVFRFDDFSDAYYALRRGEAGADAELAAELAALDAFLAATPFLTGGEFGLADISYLPWLLRLRDLMGVSLEPYPAVGAWLSACAERPSVAAEIETVASLVA
jgi:glutathione S-transferase